MKGGGCKVMKILKWISGRIVEELGSWSCTCKTVVVRLELLKLNCSEYVVEVLMYVVVVFA